MNADTPNADSPDTPAVRRVVIVDDVAALRRLVQIVLEGSGDFVVVGEAGDGAAAVEVVGETRPDLVLLDLSMPRMSGLEAMRDIIRAAPGVRVVVLSGFDRRRMAAAAIERGAIGYLEKGLTPNALVTQLRRLLEAADPGGDVGVDRSGDGSGGVSDDWATDAGR